MRIIFPRLLALAVLACPLFAWSQTAPPATCDPNSTSGYVCNSATGGSSLAIGAAATASGGTSVAVGFQSQVDANSANSTALGPYTSITNSTTSTAIGPYASVTGTTSNPLYDGIAIGFYAASTANETIAIGTQTSTHSDGAIALGMQAAAGDATNFPTGSLTWGNQVAIGDFASAQGGSGVALGTAAKVDPLANYSLAIGPYAEASATDCAALGALSTCTRSATVSVGNQYEQRQLANVAPGSDGFDAVNVNQLASVVSALGGGASFTGGIFTAPEYVLTNPYTAGTYTSVGSAISALDAAISDVPAGTPGAPLTVDYDSSSRTSVTLKGQGGTSIHHLEAGVALTDAANVGQIQEALQSAKTYTDLKSVETLSAANSYTDWRVGLLSSKIKQAVAIATAQSQMVATYAGADPTSANRVAVGTGWQGGYGALAVGYQHVAIQTKHRITWNVGASISGGDGAVGAGMGFSW